jgi:hypothetical protein
VADERDVIGVRTNHRNETVRRYSLGADGPGAADFLLDYIKSINGLVAKPTWYNALRRNCTTVIFDHASQIGISNPFDWRMLANGAVDELLYMQGSIKHDLPFEEVRKQADITLRAKAAGSSANFSELIR